MRRTLGWIATLWLTALALTTSTHAASESDAGWARWRGPRMDGSVPAGDPPIHWSETQNVRFKVAIPGLGSGTPVVWGDTIYLLTAIPAGKGLPSDQKLEDWQKGGRAIFQGKAYVPSEERQQFVLLALDRETGATRFTKVLHEGQPHEGIHPTNSWASASAVTDGEHVVSFFGSQGIFVTDMKGDVVWSKDLGDMETRKGWGEGSSPALHGETLVVNWDHEGPSFLVALDKRTGEERWRVARDEVSSWFTPLVVEHDGRAQVITTGANHVRSYDLESGELIWTGPGLTVNSIPTPIESDGRVYVTAGYRGEALYAVDLARARGDIEGTDAIVWSYPNDTPYVASPLLYDGTLYFFKGLNNVITAVDANAGELRFGPERIPELSMVYASPVGVAGRIYAPGRKGATVVLRHGPKLETIAVNRLDDQFDASPVVLGDDLYLRGRKNLYRIARPEAASESATVAAEADVPFPQSWYGTWKGTLAIHAATGVRQTVPMELWVGATDDADRTQWTIVYGEGATRQERPYELVTLDAAAGKYEIDEKNSIHIPSTFFGKSLVAHFSVGGGWLVSQYRLEGDTLTFEILSGRAQGGETGGEGAVPVVGWKPVGGYQRATLTRDGS